MRCSAYYIFFRNLATPLKVNIIESLKKKSMSVTDLQNKLKVEQSKLSHALMNLKTCNLVISKQKGKQRIYSLNKNTIIPIVNIIDKHKSKYCKGICCKIKRK
jgi:DNA-binding transcriptional ArsR family regulator